MLTKLKNSIQEIISDKGIELSIESPHKIFLGDIILW